MGGRLKGRWRFLFYKCLFTISLLIYTFFFYSFHSLENYICWLFYQTLCVLGELRPYLVRVERTNMHSSATPDTRTLCGAAGGVDVGN